MVCTVIFYGLKVDCQSLVTVSVSLLTVLDIQLKLHCWRSSMISSHQRAIDRQLYHSAVTGHLGYIRLHWPWHPPLTSRYRFQNQQQCTWLAPFFCHGSDAVCRRRYRAFITSQLYIWHATGQCSRTVALCHVHFTDEQSCCSTRSLLPSILWRHSAVHIHSTSLCHRSIQDTLTVRRRHLSVVSAEQTTAEPIKDRSCSFRHMYSAQ